LLGQAHNSITMRLAVRVYEGYVIFFNYPIPTLATTTDLTNQINATLLHQAGEAHCGTDFWPWQLVSKSKRVVATGRSW